MSLPARRRVSIKDVAAAAGVSLQTVSRVVNGAEAVAAPTRERVLAAIAELGYRRNELARNLIQGRSRTLGVICAGHDHQGGRQLNSGITAEAEALGYALLIREHQADDPVPDDAFVESLLDRQVEGILWMLADTRAEHDSLLRRIVAEHGVPVVALVRSRSVGVPFSAFDNFSAGLMATRHLIARGRRAIAHIAGPAHSWDAQERLRGWREAMREAGLAADDTRVVNGDWSPEGGARGLSALLERGPLDAVFASNDHTALGAMLAAHRRGLSIPRDVAFVGVDDIQGAGWYLPPLTTIRRNRVAMGREAVRMLAALIEARHAGQVLELPDYLHPPELIVRESA
ncbi:MAG: LacI family DNA-binding transcriptional regulator [Candidatus Dactylopiibacterium sp.]|nr:LacI family DNA-binding transcriptional regulator [Candidatus Dactylopiibacterium sp.]